MLKNTLLRTLVLLVLTFAGLILMLPTPSAPPDVYVNEDTDMDVATKDSGALLIANTRLFDGKAIIENVDWLVEGGVITNMGLNLAAPAEVTRLDATEFTVLPGLIDAHTHTFGTALEDSLRFGVTTNLDMFMSVDLMQRVKGNPEVANRADLFSAGTLATAAGGHGTQFGFPIETLAHPEDAAGWVARRKADGSNYIKLVYIPNQTSIPSIDLATASAIIEAAHDNDLLALAHISTEAAALDMVNAGIDGLVHIFADKLVSETFIQRAIETDIFIIPTLTTLAGIDEPGANARLAKDSRLAPYLRATQALGLAKSFGEGLPGFDLSIALANTGKLQAAGVAILAGSDAPNPGTTHGASLHHELELLVRAGLSNLAALSAATATPAAAFNLGDRGYLRPGAPADFLIVRGNPLENISSTRDIVAVYKNGHKVERSIVDARAKSQPLQANLGTFESGLDAPEGFIWTGTDDGMAGGNSTAAVEASHDGHLNVQGKVTSGFAFPWAGASLMLQDQTAGPASLAEYSELSFSIRGTVGTYRVMMFDAAVAGVPPTQSFKVSQSWQTVSLALRDFRGFSSSDFVGLAIVAGPEQGEFQYQIDNVTLN